MASDSITPDEPPASSGARFDSKLRRQSKQSISWTILRFASDQVFSFVVFVLMARLLSRADIGAFALISIFALVFRTISMAGLVETVARERELSPAFMDTVYRSHMGFSLITCTFIVAVADPFAAFMNAPQIAAPLQVLSLTLPISSLGETHLALRLREFGHKTTALRSVVSGIGGGGAAIAAALMGFGLWALVIQRILTVVISVVLSRQAYRWKPGWNWQWSILKRNLSINGSLTAMQLVYLAMSRMQELVIGNVIGIVAVGIYRTAWRTVDIISIGAIRPFSSVALQTLSRVKEDPVELAHAYQWVISKASALSFPALVGFGILAPEAVPVVFGAKWAQAGDLAQIFAFMAVPFTLNQFATPSLGALGAARILLFIALAQLALTAILTFSLVRFGLFAVACGFVARAYIILPVQIYMLKRVSGIGFRQTWNAIWRPFAASAIMGVILYLLRHSTVGLAASTAIPFHLGPWIALLLKVAIGALVYGLMLISLSPFWRAQALKVCRKVLPNRVLPGAGA
ncbi:lipopolysaccharide biosynthesis protein [Novosphingobium malaysiense]|uniref:lipopolysaccharide biosynthesis protein n=1 Tax=Novosphingobium malaysiense TaxID=1348853 RepID=UPI00068B48A8|nr:lipopolysaccharide biosynthesis protein [Novosphingobium malaysiense]